MLFQQSLAKRSNEAGFTLIELLVVISMITILAAMGMVQYRNSIRRAEETTLKHDLFHMRDAIDQYYADKNEYPPAIDSLVSEGYLRSIPKDPFTGSETTWQTSPAEPDARNPTAIPGIYRITSGSDQTAMDGTRYADW